MLVEGVTVEHRDSEGRIRGAQVQVIDFDISTSNDWLPVNQFTVTENRNEPRTERLPMLGPPSHVRQSFVKTARWPPPSACL